jgi:signal transduction histidine kinase
MIVSIFLGLTYTNINIPIFNIDSCESIEGSIFKLGYLVEMFIAIVLLSYIIYKYIKERDIYFKKQILLIGAGILFFLLSFSWTNVFGSITLDWKMTQYGLFGMPVFIGILAYMIVKFKAFNIKLIGTQALIVAQVILIASMFAFVRTTTNQVLTGITLFLTAVMGWNLIRSVKKEVALREALEISSAELVERKDELQMMADRLAQSNDQLRTLDNAKSEFISIASHQLRTPLTAIKGFLSLLLEGSYGPVGEKHVEVLNKIYISNERLITLVEDLLNISRIESGRMEFKFDQWDLEKICGEVLDTFALRAKDNDLYLEYTPPETPVPEVTIDGVKVREVISNLVDNALKYTLHGHGGVTLRLQQVGDAARITVADTGIGVPATELPYLFAKFSRGKDISRLNTGGTGLGLYVGRNMIESNGGKIWAESDGQDHGSRFIIEIPLVQSPELLAKWE